jgi:hypothetical protein
MSPSTDWRAWHQAYADPGSDLSRRRRSVQAQLDAWLDAREDTALRVVSACSGDGRDLLEVLARRPDGHRVRARLVELDPSLAGDARAYAAAHGLDTVEVLEADAGRTGSYAGVVPADLVMMCGVWGNVTDEDVRGSIRVLRELCAPGATVVWTRGRFRSGDLTGDIRTWFGEAGFEEVAFDAPVDATYRVGAHRIVGDPATPGADRTFFTFVR